MSDRYVLEVDGERFAVEVTEEAPDFYRVRINGRTLAVRVLPEEDITAEMVPPSPPKDGARAPQARAETGRTVAEVRAPIPGTIVSVEVAPGQEVKYGDTLVVLEAMKMKNLIRSPRDGRVAEVLVQPGQSVMYNDVLVRYDG